MTAESTASPKNSSLSLDSPPPFSLTKELWTKTLSRSASSLKEKSSRPLKASIALSLFMKTNPLPQGLCYPAAAEHDFTVVKNHRLPRRHCLLRASEHDLDAFAFGRFYLGRNALMAVAYLHRNVLPLGRRLFYPIDRPRQKPAPEKVVFPADHEAVPSHVYSEHIIRPGAVLYVKPFSLPHGVPEKPVMGSYDLAAARNHVSLSGACPERSRRACPFKNKPRVIIVSYEAYLLTFFFFGDSEAETLRAASHLFFRQLPARKEYFAQLSLSHKKVKKTLVLPREEFRPR